MSRNFLEIHSLQNLTTEFELIKNLKARPLEVLEYGDKSFTIEAAPRMCGLGTILHIEGKFHIAGLESDFLATGKVAVSSPLEDGKLAKYTVELHRFDKGLWEKFLEANMQSQLNTEMLFRAMRDLD
ncbi:hypothetical protein [Bdellovibrio sp. HCB209]|uniref:hypothetical protein n=1 Tax=Bdellovibrio sp. HCB209 TaxID=3394354 RepID=UPI0039B67AD5